MWRQTGRDLVRPTVGRMILNDPVTVASCVHPVWSSQKFSTDSTGEENMSTLTAGPSPVTITANTVASPPTPSNGASTGGSAAPTPEVLYALLANDKSLEGTRASLL
ncbi:Hypp4520 [Branchiostoma lanceolatum]|uniref:Hypp4520 protein n=1 Tax=Branchiostoma lanceolatum TaxID=7740 RepID=A0A8K0EW13_BRALA|nr:Hypp4520 [Branchiostoma lanceolatum]